VATDSDGRIQSRSLEDPISLEESISADDDGSRKCADEPHDRSPLSERALADVGGASAVYPSLWLWRASAGCGAKKVRAKVA
jgi:hypothetical protein